MSVSGPSTLISVTEETIDLAADSDLSPLCRLIDLTTSSAVSDLPLLNWTPLRNFTIHLVPFSVGSKLSASSGLIVPSGATSVRFPRTLKPSINIKVSLNVVGSRVSVVDPPAREALRWPPFT